MSTLDECRSLIYVFDITMGRLKVLLHAISVIWFNSTVSSVDMRTL